MATMNVSLPDPMKDWVEAQARSGRYSNASDYVRDLIRRDQERASKLAELQRLIDEGLASGVSGRSMGEVLQEARTRAGVGRNDL
jgi:antitoxin ParD1/3/4